MKPAFRKIAVIYLLLFYLSPLFSQVLSKKEFIKAVQQADIFYYYNEDYEKAAPLYEKLSNIYPDNSNLSAKLGICYLNIDGRKSDALRLLIQASKNIVRYDKEYVEFGDKAPLDTYLYLAIAYHQNDSLKKAISLYSNAKIKLGRTKLFREEYMDKQISNCNYAMELQTKPQAVISNFFAPWLIDYPGACNPALSKNDSVFVFTLRKDGKNRIFCSYKTDKWNRPLDISRQLGNNTGMYSNSLTADGKLLIIYKLDGDDGNLYYSQRKDSTWTKIKSLNINTVYWESHGFITPDGKTLYFASNRPGGQGDLDIWVSNIAANGTWKTAVNCGRVINTPYNENTPYYDPEENALFFSSVGHVSMGGYDVFRSTNKDGRWTNPIGLPYSLNSTSENLNFILNNSGTGFITSLYDENTKSRNIYSLITGDQKDKTILANGTVSLQDGMAVDPGLTNIQLTDQKTGSIKKITLDNKYLSKFPVTPGDFKLLIKPIKSKSDSTDLNTKAVAEEESISLNDTASFKIEMKPGDYQLSVSHQGYSTDTIRLNISSNYSSTYIPVNASLIPDKVFEGKFLSIKIITFGFDSYKLDEKAISILEILKSILVNYPDLKIEVAGYTDSKGSNEYNKKLADKRAQAVIDYLTASGISQSEFEKKAFGASDFVAINTNPDGSDNPEGRKYNRRAVFGIINPKTGIVLRQETYTPERLRNSQNKTKDALKSVVSSGIQTGAISGKIVYTIQLTTSKKPMNMDLFKNVDGVKEIVSNDGYIRYVCGEYKSFTKAKEALIPLQKAGFKNAFIRELNLLVNQ